MLPDDLPFSWMTFFSNIYDVVYVLESDSKTWQMMNFTKRVPLPQATLRGHLEGVSALQFWNGSRFLISGDYGGNLMLWDTMNRISCWTDGKSQHDCAVMEIYPSSFCKLLYCILL